MRKLVRKSTPIESARKASHMISSEQRNEYTNPPLWIDWVFSVLFAGETLLIALLALYVWMTSTPLGYGGASIIGVGIVCFYAPLVFSFLFHQARLFYALRKGDSPYGFKVRRFSIYTFGTNLIVHALILVAVRV